MKVSSVVDGVVGRTKESAQCSPNPIPSSSRLHRRAALAGLGAAVASLGLGVHFRSAAQEATPEGVTLTGTPTGGERLASWAPGQTATINGAALYYEVHGDPAGQPVLLLHGGLGNTEDWLNLAPVLVGAGYRVVAMDCRGRGRSTWGDLPITYEQMAADTLRMLDQLGIAKDGCRRLERRGDHRPRPSHPPPGAPRPDRGLRRQLHPRRVSSSAQLTSCPPSNGSSSITGGWRRSRNGSRSGGRARRPLQGRAELQRRGAGGASTCRSWSWTGRRRN